MCKNLFLQQILILKIEIIKLKDNLLQMNLLLIFIF
jgi:hypothetical protein